MGRSKNNGVGLRVRRMSSRLAPWLAALLVGAAPALHAQTLPEVQVSTAQDFQDFEFDWGRDGVFCSTCNFGDGNARLTYVDSIGNLWLGYVDFQTGAFYPQDGHGVLLDTGAAPANDYGNGPEWMFSTGGSQIVYTKYVPNRPHSAQTAGIGVASMVNGAWSAGYIANPLNRQSPAATLDLTDADPRINYQDTSTGRLYWRAMSDPGTEHLLPIGSQTQGGSRRWVSGTHKVIYAGAAPPDSTGTSYVQMYLYDTDTGAKEQLTFDPTAKMGGFMWRAPEYNNEYVFFTVADRTKVVVYRKLPGPDGVPRWTIVKSQDTPSQLPYVWSPEPFTHNGRSYIFFQLSSSPKFRDYSIPTQIAMTGIDPLRQDFRMLTNDSVNRRLRLDPEYFITAQGPYIYYLRFKLETSTTPAISDGIWRVDTKLGPPQANVVH